MSNSVIRRDVKQRAIEIISFYFGFHHLSFVRTQYLFPPLESSPLYVTKKPHPLVYVQQLIHYINHHGHQPYGWESQYIGCNWMRLQQEFASISSIVIPPVENER